MAKRKPEKFNLGDLHRIKTKEEAEQFIKEYLKVFDKEHSEMPHEERMRIIKSNIGYCSGYYDAADATRILELFDTCHPVFGKSRPTPKEAFEAGVRMGEAMRKQGKK